MFEFVALLFDCFVYRQDVTCLKRFTRYGHYAMRWKYTFKRKLKAHLLNEQAIF